MANEFNFAPQPITEWIGEDLEEVAESMTKNWRPRKYNNSRQKFLETLRSGAPYNFSSILIIRASESSHIICKAGLPELVH